MVPIVQLVRASDCGSECRGFESHWAPKKEVERLPFFVQWDENQVRNRRSRLSGSERIPLGTQEKETDSSSVSYFVQGGMIRYFFTP